MIQKKKKKEKKSRSIEVRHQDGRVSHILEVEWVRAPPSGGGLLQHGDTAHLSEEEDGEEGRDDTEELGPTEDRGG